MTELLKLVTDGWEQLTRSPVWMIIALMCLGIGLLCKSSNAVPNRLIPFIVVTFSTVAYMFMGDEKKIEHHHPRVMLAFYGFLLGFLVWAAHKFLLKKLERFLPDGFFPPGCFDTKQFQKDKDKIADKDEAESEED